MHLCLKEGLAEVLVYMEENYLTVSPTNAYLIAGNGLDGLDALSADILGKD
jgi:hypothetical protein